MREKKSFLELTAADLMTHEVTAVPRHLSLRKAAHLLSQAHVSGAPVVDGCGACVGVISSTDFVHWVEDGRPVRVEDPQAGCACSDWQVFEAEEEGAEKVGAYMTVDPVTTKPTTRMSDLARMMLDAHIHRVIVVDEQNRPVGVVSSTDILAAVVAEDRHQDRR
jgi:CBS domain-containing protein